MFKKFFYIIISFLVGIVLVILGSLFKIMHYSNADLFLISGMFFELLALLLLIVKIVKQSQKEKV